MEAKTKREARGALMLTITSLIWGIAFVFQSTGMDHIGPFTFNFFRCCVCLIFLVCVDRFFTVKSKKNKVYKKMDKKEKNALLIGGVLAGLTLFLGMSFQQAGMMYTSVSKAGFITTLYIVFIPIMERMFGRKTSMKTWVCVFMSAVGLYLLSIKGGFKFELGDTLIFISSISFGCQIIVVDRFAPHVDSVKLSMVEFFATGVLSFIAMIVFEDVNMSAVASAGIAILYTGLMSSGIGFTLQIVAQKDLPATISSLIMSLESVFSAFAGVLILHEVMTQREILGATIIFIAVVSAQIQLPEKFKSFFRVREKVRQ